MAGTDTFVQVAPDSTGKKIRNFLNTILGNDVLQQVVTLAKSDGTLLDAAVPVSSAAASQVDGHSATIGTTTDAASANTVIGRLKTLVTLLSGGLPAALSAGGGVKVGVVDALPAGTNTIGNAVQRRPLNKTLAGVYFYHSGRGTVQAAADAATAGRAWLVNTDAAKKVRIKRIKFRWNSTAATAFASSPRLTIERFTFTGTPSGATITAAKRLTGDATPVASMRTASTGMTITAGAAITAFLVGAVLTAVGVNMADQQEWVPLSDDESLLELGQNEGIVIRQADAGSASDTRVWIMDIEAEEY